MLNGTELTRLWPAWGPAALVASMDPNQGTGYGARIGRVNRTIGAVTMVESVAKPFRSWPTFSETPQHGRRPRLKFVMLHGNHRFQGRLRRIVHHGCGPRLL